MGPFSSDRNTVSGSDSNRDVSRILAPLVEPLPLAMGHRARALSQKSALLLRVLRQKARATRNKKPKEFYSIREVANRFEVPLTTVSRIYTQLRAEGLLTTVWGSKTFIAPTNIDNNLRIRGVVALPASRVSFCAIRQYRNFFSEICDALWPFGFATQLLFYEDNEAELPMLADRLLKHRLDIVIWFLSTPKLKQIMARVADRGISAITVVDSAEDCCGYRYRVDREPAIRDAFLSWRKHGIRSVIVLQNPPCGLSGTLTQLKKCLRDAAMPYSLANVGSLSLPDVITTPAQQPFPGIIFPSSDTAMSFIARDTGGLATLSERSRILLVHGAVDVPGSYTIPHASDVVEIDSQAIAKQIVNDLIQSTRSRKTVPVVFQAKWIRR